MIFYLEESTVESGATLVVPGTYHFPGVEGGLHDHEWLQALFDQAVPVPMPRGGMLITDSMIVHSVGRNTTDGTRTSMTFGFHSVDELSDFDNPKTILLRGERTYSGNDARY